MFGNKIGNDDQNCGCGLVWVCPNSRKQIPIPLRSVNLTASVVHAVAQVEITQVYVNSEQDPIEASYIFPVDSNGAVTYFHAELDGKIIKGVVKSSKEAEKDYETAIKRRQTALLGEEIKPDVFQLKVGFLKPGAEARVVIGYVTEVKNDPDSHSIRFVIPTTVAPRYVPSSSKDDENEARSSKLAKMTFSSAPPAPMDLKVVISIQGEIKSVESLSSHKILVESKGIIAEQTGNWHKAVVTLAGNVTEMDRDFVLLVTPSEAVMHPRVYHEVLESGSVAAMAHLIPSFALKEEKVELVIVVDRSGSMEGNSIRMASVALQLFIHSLPADCYFNIAGFGSSYEFLFKEGSQKYDQNSLLQAEKCAKNLDAELGGTEILEPLKEIYSKPPIPGYLRQIFVITDGEVSNTEEVIGLVKRNAHNSRLFALGIGASSSRHLVQGMASAGGGTCAFVEQDDNIQRATLSQLKNALQPSLTDIKIEWLGLPVPLPVELNKEKTLFGYNKPLNPTTDSVENVETFSQAPKIIPPIFDGNQMVVFGIFPPSLGRPNGVKITANSPDGPLNVEIPINEDNNLGSTEMIHKLAVIKLIREMELEEMSMTSNSSHIREQIEALGVQHGITSKYTSYIAWDDSSLEECDFSGVMQIRKVASQLPHGHNRHHRSLIFMVEYCDDNGDCLDYEEEEDEWEAGQENLCTPAAFSSNLWDLDAKENELEEQLRQRHAAKMELSANASVANENETPLDADSLPISTPSIGLSKAEIVMGIVNQQKFDGSFSNDFQTLCQALGISYDEAKTEAVKKGWDQNLFHFWATALALTFLTRDDFKSEVELWELVVRKGNRWMTHNCKDENLLKEIMEHVKLFLQSQATIGTKVDGV